MSDSGTTRGTFEIRSYRSVFALERRIYRIDSLRLNPSGVPLRGLGYALALVALSLPFGALPLIATVPWYLRNAAIPLIVSGVLTALRVDGRTVHLAAGSLLGWRFGPRRTRRFAPAHDGKRWRPPCVLCIPDGSDARPRAMRFRGPGTALVCLPHVLSEWRSRPDVTIEAIGCGGVLRRPVAVDLAPGGELHVRPAKRLPSDRA